MKRISRLAVATGLAGLLASGLWSAGPATAGEPQPSLSYLSSFWTYPAPATTDRPVQLWLGGEWPFRCADIVSTELQDPSHIAIHIRQREDCPDTAQVRWPWSQEIDLGFLQLGLQSFTVQLTVDGDPAYGGATHVYSEDVNFDVVSPLGPPVPHDMGSWLVRCLGGWSGTPRPLDNRSPATIRLWGWFPYFCGHVSAASVIDSGHVALTLSPGPTCADTVQVWDQSFLLGRLATGWHTLHLDLTVLGDSAGNPALRQAAFDFEVVDSSLVPPPIAPPADSLAGLSASAPNPFAVKTQFSVSVHQPAQAEVAIFDLQGRRVRLLYRGPLDAGEHPFVWNGHLEDGRHAARGVYFYRLAMPGRVVTRRIVMLAGQ